MSKVPSISVLLPVYNAQPYLDAAVGSILMQSFRDFELIAVDDGSTDGSLALLQQYARMDSRVRVITRPHSGIAGALNDGVAAAAGEFLARMDGDDISVPSRFEKQVAFLRQHADVVLVGSRVLLIDPDGQTLFETEQPLENPQIQHALLSDVGWVVVHSAAMMRTAAVRAAGGYRMELAPCEELDLLVRLSEAGHLANLPQILLLYRQYEESSNAAESAKRYDAIRQILSDAFGRRGVTMADDWSPSRRSILPIRKQTNMRATLALKKGNIAAARKHAFSLVKMNPFSVGSWRLMFSAIRGR
jgi:glycosyltransferase involved in cell wall biosynthesis